MEKLLYILYTILSLWQLLGLIRTALCSLCMSSRIRIRISSILNSFSLSTMIAGSCELSKT